MTPHREAVNELLVGLGYPTLPKVQVKASRVHRGWTSPDPVFRKTGNSMSVKPTNMGIPQFIPKS